MNSLTKGTVVRWTRPDGNPFYTEELEKLRCPKPILVRVGSTENSRLSRAMPLVTAGLNKYRMEVGGFLVSPEECDPENDLKTPPNQCRGMEVL